MKRTYQPNTRKRAKCHGFRARMSTKGGRKVLAALVAPRREASLRVKRALGWRPSKSRGDISDLFSCGKRLHTPYLTFIVLPTKQHGQQGRVAFIAGKKSGNAVWRNSAKRRMRAVCHELGGTWAGYDVIFLAKSGIMRILYSKVHTACAETLKRAELR